MKTLVIASNNKHKIDEISALFTTDNLPFNLKSMHDIGCLDDIAETATTIEGNASLKSIYIAEKYKMNCFADDTGLEVSALNGAPGVYSARFAGEQKNDADNCSLLLQKLQNQTNRKAQFKTIISLQWQQSEYFFEGIAKGSISLQPKGNNGFGYDPLFIPDGYNLTFAEMNVTEKNLLSHRAKAIEKLITFLKLLS
jgi:XTP/dITP diphosphohydrolase